MALLYFRTQYTFPCIFLPVPTGTYQCCFLHYPTHTLNNADLTLTTPVLFDMMQCPYSYCLCNHTTFAKNGEAQLVPRSIRRRQKTDDHLDTWVGKVILQKPHYIQAPCNTWVSGQWLLRLWAGYQLLGAFTIFKLEAGKQPWFTLFVSRTQLSN